MSLKTVKDPKKFVNFKMSLNFRRMFLNAAVQNILDF